MGMFDFLKRKEINRIKYLESEIIKFQGIIDINKEIEDKKLSLHNINNTYNDLNGEYIKSLEIYENLKKEINIFENKLNNIEFGVYEPIFDFDKSDNYRIELDNIRKLLKKMVTNNTAAICSTNLTVNESKIKGDKMINIYKKLMIRAFNGECDVLISKVKWNSFTQSKERILKVFQIINKLGETMSISINKDYLDLKLNELILEHEYNLKKYEEKEKLREIQETIREEEKVRREFEQAQKEAEKEEIIYQKALERARNEFNLTGENSKELMDKIKDLEEMIKSHHEKKERLLSMAQQTKRGHVYIISNIGSFGENIYKIGMTRRLEPMDRVNELGDASVPFKFDVHAIIYSDNARYLEGELHKAFSSKKVNMANNRKEFFNVTIDEIEDKVKELGFNSEFIKLPEAFEFRETLSILNKNTNINNDIITEFPKSLNPS